MTETILYTYEVGMHSGQRIFFHRVGKHDDRGYSPLILTRDEWVGMGKPAKLEVALRPVKEEAHG